MSSCRYRTPIILKLIAVDLNISGKFQITLVLKMTAMFLECTLLYFKLHRLKFTSDFGFDVNVSPPSRLSPLKRSLPQKICISFPLPVRVLSQSGCPIQRTHFLFVLISVFFAIATKQIKQFGILFAFNNGEQHYLNIC